MTNDANRATLAYRDYCPSGSFHVPVTTSLRLGHERWPCLSSHQASTPFIWPGSKGAGTGGSYYIKSEYFT